MRGLTRRLLSEQRATLAHLAPGAITEARLASGSRLCSARPRAEPRRANRWSDSCGPVRLLLPSAPHALLGQAPPVRERLRVTLVRKVYSTAGVDEFVRVMVGRVGGRTVAAPLARGAGLMTSLVRADGWLVIPRTSEGIEAGAEVDVELRRPAAAIASTVVVVGSHDVALDVLADFLRRADPTSRLASAHVGSLGGLLALRRGEAHMAGVHLLDEDTGEYNVSYVREYLPGSPTVLVTPAQRDQGLLVAPGNPKHIKGIADLARTDMRFVNRQRGAGTRVLLDYELRRAGLSPRQVEGYDREGADGRAAPAH
jgi:putative molybdopterin biosynthesis protein